MIPHRDYELIDPAEMVPDPAQAVEWFEKGEGDKDAIRKIGAWRWKVLQHHRERVLCILAAAEYIVDFGGAAGPLGYNSLIVDRIAERQSLLEIPGKPDVIFTAHTLEHIQDVRLAMKVIAEKLSRGGYLICIVPSWRNKTLWHENWPRHRHTFRLSADKEAKRFTPLDTLIAECGLEPERGSDIQGSILVIARKPA